PWNLTHLRQNRRDTLAADGENRGYVSALVDFASKSPRPRAFIYDGAPAAFHPWGTEGVLRFLYGQPAPELYSIEDKQADLQRDDVVLYRWSRYSKPIVLSSKTLSPYLALDGHAPPWQ